MRKSAFTMVEVVVVLVIAAIVAIVVLPVMNSGIYVGRAAEVIATHLHYAQQLAMTTGDEHGVSFAVGSETYQVYRENGGETIINDPLQPENQLIVDLTEEPYRNVDIVSANFQSGATVSSKVLFDNFGVPQVDNDAANPDITSGTVILSGGGITRTVTVEPSTGKVIIQ